MPAHVADRRAGAITVRDATASDNAALVALASACPMRGSVGLCMERSPDFLALNRLEGDRFRLGVVDDGDGTPIGCIAVSFRTAYVAGQPRPMKYVGDLKVHPSHRTTGVADALARWAEEVCIAEHVDGPTLLTVLSGNRAMQRRYPGPRSLPTLHPVATIRTFSVPVLWRHRVAGGVRVRSAVESDIDAMCALWQGTAPARNFTPAFDACSLKRWITEAPGLSIGDYLVAFDEGGALLGFLGLWDQQPLKQTRVISYSRGLTAFRAAFNAAAPLFGGTRLPAAGGIVRQRTALHLCVADDRVDTLRALVVRAHNALRGHGYSFFNVGLDRNDPLCAAFRGLGAQSTDITACLAVRNGATPMTLDGRPVHHEIALV